jgi:hypothetical protein
LVATRPARQNEAVSRRYQARLRSHPRAFHLVITGLDPVIYVFADAK